MIKHTPGPWEILGKGKEIELTYSRSGKSVMFNCLVGNNGETGIALFPELDGKTYENEANARLIAAAPELLEALKISENELTKIERNWECECSLEIAGVLKHDCGLNEIKIALKNTRQAIAKAQEE